jgi:hypothetical protein
MFGSLVHRWSNRTEAPVSLHTRASREETFLPGILIFPSGQALDCIIQNLSESGALARLEGLADPAASMILVLPRSPTARYVSPVWRKYFDVGLRFDQAIDLRAPEAPLEHVARLLWIERSPTQKSA